MNHFYKKRFLNILLALLSWSSSHAQFCGSIPGPEGHSYKLPLHEKSLDEIIKIPIVIHIVGNENEPITISNINGKITNLNEEFSETNIEFSLCGTPNYIQDFSAIHSYYSVGSMAILNNKAGAVNFYIVNRLDLFPFYELENNPKNGGFAIIPDERNIKRRYIFMTSASFNSHNIMGHELGHFLGLYHTHETKFGEELADGSNCHIAGDLLCDTPADPTIGFENSRSCEYTGSDIDANGAEYKPDMENIMSYASTECTNRFSAEQIERMRFTAKNLYHFNISCPPSFEESILYPNPTPNRLNVSLLNNHLKTHVDFIINNSLGQIVISEKGYKLESAYNITLDTRYLPQGNYFLKVFYKQPNVSETYQFIKF